MFQNIFLCWNWFLILSLKLLMTFELNVNSNKYTVIINIGGGGGTGETVPQQCPKVIQGSQVANKKMAFYGLFRKTVEPSKSLQFVGHGIR